MECSLCKGTFETTETLVMRGEPFGFCGQCERVILSYIKLACHNHPNVLVVPRKTIQLESKEPFRGSGGSRVG